MIGASEILKKDCKEGCDENILIGTAFQQPNNQEDSQDNLTEDEDQEENTLSISYNILKEKIAETQINYNVHIPTREDVRLETAGEVLSPDDLDALRIKVVSKNFLGKKIVPMKYNQNDDGSTEISSEYLGLIPEKKIILDDEICIVSNCDFNYFNTIPETPPDTIFPQGTFFRVAYDTINEGVLLPKCDQQVYFVTKGNCVCAIPNKKTLQVMLVERNKVIESVIVIESFEFQEFEVTGDCPDRSSEWVSRFGVESGCETPSVDFDFDVFDNIKFPTIPDVIQGPPGMPGLQGVQGPQGINGFNGNDGDDGEDGDEGPEGPEGPTGPEGPEGPTGPEGPAGEDGECPDCPKTPLGEAEPTFVKPKVIDGAECLTYEITNNSVNSSQEEGKQCYKWRLMNFSLFVPARFTYSPCDGGPRKKVFIPPAVLPLPPFLPLPPAPRRVEGFDVRLENTFNKSAKIKRLEAVSTGVAGNAADLLDDQNISSTSLRVAYTACGGDPKEVIVDAGQSIKVCSESIPEIVEGSLMLATVTPKESCNTEIPPITGGNGCRKYKMQVNTSEGSCKKWYVRYYKSVNYSFEYESCFGDIRKANFSDYEERIIESKDDLASILSSTDFDVSLEPTGINRVTVEYRDCDKGLRKIEMLGGESREICTDSPPQVTGSGKEFFQIEEIGDCATPEDIEDIKDIGDTKTNVTLRHNRNQSDTFTFLSRDVDQPIVVRGGKGTSVYNYTVPFFNMQKGQIIMLKDLQGTQSSKELLNVRISVFGKNEVYNLSSAEYITTADMPYVGSPALEENIEVLFILGDISGVDDNDDPPEPPDRVVVIDPIQGGPDGNTNDLNPL